MSSHYQTGKSLSDEIINKVSQSRHTNLGLFNLKQASLAAFDLRAHLSDGLVTYTKLWSDTAGSSTLLATSVGYYGYNHSLVFAADMYAAVFKDDPLDPVRGRGYREKILGPGSASKDEMDLLKAVSAVMSVCKDWLTWVVCFAQDFLGREPSSEAFIEQLFGHSAWGSAA
ncbi:peptidase family M3-domain-containing protein [Trametes meyenii]|nr:peptidase family M3-domain-containing protein [Trametes meyenii]